MRAQRRAVETARGQLRRPLPWSRQHKSNEKEHRRRYYRHRMITCSPRNRANPVSEKMALVLKKRGTEDGEHNHQQDGKSDVGHDQHPHHVAQ